MPRLAWTDYEFLRSGRSLRTLVGELSGDLWDRDALLGRVRAIESGRWRHGLLPMADQMAKIITLDWLLR